jgi:hypothetical protein
MAQRLPMCLVPRSSTAVSLRWRCLRLVILMLRQPEPKCLLRPLLPVDSRRGWPALSRLDAELCARVAAGPSGLGELRTWPSDTLAPGSLNDEE